MGVFSVYGIMERKRSKAEVQLGICGGFLYPVFERSFIMNNAKYEVLKDEMKAFHLETARLLIRNYIDLDEDGYLTIFQD